MAQLTKLNQPKETPEYKVSIRPAYFGEKPDNQEDNENFCAVVQNQDGYVWVVLKGMNLTSLTEMFRWDGNAGFEINELALTDEDEHHFDWIVYENAPIRFNVQDPAAKPLLEIINFIHDVKDDKFPNNGYQQHYSLVSE